MVRKKTGVVFLLSYCLIIVLLLFKKEWLTKTAAYLINNLEFNKSGDDLKVSPFKFRISLTCDFLFFVYTLKRYTVSTKSICLIKQNIKNRDLKNALCFTGE